MVCLQQDANHPKDNMAKSRTATASEETRSILILHCQSSDFAPYWGEVLLETHKDYLKTNARTDEGRQVFVVVNNVVTKWETCLSGYTSDTLTVKKCYDLALIIARKGCRVEFGFGEPEGFHRAGSSVQALTGSRIDCTTGVISGTCELTYQQFVDSGVVKVSAFDPGARFQDVVENALSGKCIYFDKTSNVEVKEISANFQND